MPKMKTHSGAKKRFRITGTGKVMREQANGRHLLEHKSSRYHPVHRRRRPAAPSPTPRRSRSSSAQPVAEHPRQHLSTTAPQHLSTLSGTSSCTFDGDRI